MRFRCGHCPFATDKEEEIKAHVDTHDRDAMYNFYCDGIKVICRITPRARQLRDLLLIRKKSKLES